MHLRPRLAIRLLAIIAALAATGCVSRSYKFAEYERQAKPLNFAATPPPADAAANAPFVEASVNTVIILHGPGSWKRHAYWDEYVLSLHSRADTPVTLESATLTDFQDQGVSPGANPWALEKASRSYETRLASTMGDALAIGSGVVVAGGTGVAAGALAAAVGSASGWTTLGLLGGGLVAAVPVYAIGTVYRNVSHRKRIEEEFARRSLTLPLTLPPGILTQGSLFYRISPGPKRLTLRTRSADGTTGETIIDLSRLAGLHFKANSADAD
jgi:hypothetical protein